MSSLPVASFELPTYHATIASPLPTYDQQWGDTTVCALTIPAAAHGSNRDMFVAGPALEASRPATSIAMSALTQPRSSQVVASHTAPSSRSACLGAAASCFSATAIGFGMLVAVAIFPGSFIAGAALTVNGIIDGNSTLLKAGVPLLILGLIIGIGLKKANAP